MKTNHLLQAILALSFVVCAITKAPVMVAFFITTAVLYGFLAKLEQKKIDETAALQAEIKAVADRVEQIQFANLGR